MKFILIVFMHYWATLEEKANKTRFLIYACSYAIWLAFLLWLCSISTFSYIVMFFIGVLPICAAWVKMLEFFIMLNWDESPTGPRMSEKAYVTEVTKLNSELRDIFSTALSIQFTFAIMTIYFI